MKYAEVAVDAPVAHSRTFSYSIPDGLTVGPGQLVWAPFGRRVLQGLVVELAAAPQVDVTRDILQALEPSPLLEPWGLELARWLSQYYLCSLFHAAALLLPAGFQNQVRSQVLPVPGAEAPLDANGSPESQAMVALAARRRMAEAEFLKLLGKNGERHLAQLVRAGLVQRRADLPRPGMTPRYECSLFPVAAPGPDSPWPLPSQGLAPRQQRLLQAVRESGTPYSATLANKEFGPGVADALVEQGLLGQEWRRVEAAASAAPDPSPPAPALTLTPAQADALARIIQAVDDPSQQPRSFLLHGVTGSGKTEVYLRAAQRVVERGQQVIFLVPEISLTPQTLHRVNARFPGRVAVLHSRLTPRQQFDQWWKVRDGEYDVVVGPRSALFAPVPRLGMIVLDEEHEWTYKQEEAQPLYHARTVAQKLAQITGAVLVLGSATPDVETYYHAQRGRHRLLELPQRIGQGGARELAAVQVCDMRRELREGNRSIFSRALSQAMRDCLAQGHQAILFLNRRGSAPVVQCRDCGYVATCPSCSVSLTYHAADARLVCHRCNRKVRPPRSCRQCGGAHIRRLGAGTQRVVEEVAALLPGARVDRWDADATRAGAAPEDIMSRLARGETQVLVGTQMVAKGLDLPNVTLVGVVLADIGLHLPDFRAGERGFSLLCQVAGRAGRGDAPGRVIIQTYNPEHYAVAAAAHQDYGAMYRQELAARRQQGNPPFGQLVHFVFQEINPSLCQRQAMELARTLRQKAQAQGLTDVTVVGPAPGIPSRLRGRHRWHLLLRGRQLHRFLEGISFPPACAVDVDPAHVL
ncbi:MAG TPA: primosomal protein N' [Dehalococcoidia bacterium]|nr:primosomal protein N' [Dehalococcoidia bacterium]